MKTWVIAIVAAAACALHAAASAQTGTFANEVRKQTERAAKDMNMNPQPAGSLKPCALITKADIKKATGRSPQGEPEEEVNGVCNFEIGGLRLYRSWEGWEETLKAFKKDKEPRTPAPAFGKRAQYLYVKPDNKYQETGAFLAAESGAYVVMVMLFVPKDQDKGLDGVRPALDALMKSSLARLPQ